MSYLVDCQKCMQANPTTQRQAMGCGYEAPLPDAITWTPEGLKLREDERLHFCAGYTVRLPEVLEVARGRIHWDKGNLREYCDGKPSEAMLLGVEVLEASAHELQNALMTPKSEGGLKEER